MSGADAATLLVRVIPRAACTAVGGRRGDALVIRLAALPVEGAANEALIASLAERLQCPRRAISIESGERRRDKRLRIQGVQPDEPDRHFAAFAVTRRRGR